jgi:hypothetical protein
LRGIIIISNIDHSYFNILILVATTFSLIPTDDARSYPYSYNFSINASTSMLGKLMANIDAMKFAKIVAAVTDIHAI